MISKYFGQQTYFSFSNGINGYYSNNQAFYVLEDFFKLYKVTSFKFDYIKTDKNNGTQQENIIMIIEGKEALLRFIFL